MLHGDSAMPDLLPEQIVKVRCRRMKRNRKKAVTGFLFAAMLLSILLPYIPVSAVEPENPDYGENRAAGAADEEHAKVKVIKVDSIVNVGLSGAVIGIYRDEACTDLIAAMAVTDENGEAEKEIVITQDAVYLKEMTAPSGYHDNPVVYRADLEADQTVSVTIPGTERMGSLEMAAKAHVLSEAETDEDGTKFRYWRSVERIGAVFNVYAGADIVTPYGAVVYKAGDLVAENLDTGEECFVRLENLHLGVYSITEVHAPYKFYSSRQTKTMSIHNLNPATGEGMGGAIFYFDRQKAKVSVTKTDKDTTSGVAGAVFGLYAAEDILNEFGTRILEKDTLIERAVTDENGNAVFSEEIPVEFGYYIKEEQAPEGYLKDTGDGYSFQFDYTNDREAEVEFSHVFSGTRITATIQLSKTDLETNSSKPQGDATLEHAVYGLYARKDICRPDQKTEVLYKAGERAGTLVTDKTGTAKIENLYLGEYYLKEITPPEGYLTDEKEYDLICSYEGDSTATVERSCISPEQVIKQPIQVMKTAGNGETDTGQLSGAGFTVYLLSSLEKKEDGEYDFDSAIPAVIGENGETEIFTDENGCACSIPLPYGTYLVRQTTMPNNDEPTEDFLVHITEHSPDKPQVCRIPAGDADMPAGNPEAPDSEKSDSDEADTGKSDLEEPDTEKPDLEEPDTEKSDSEEPDTGKSDLEKPDTGKSDSEKPDTETPDLGTSDSGTSDSETPDSEKADTEIKNPGASDSKITDQELKNQEPEKTAQEILSGTAPKTGDENSIRFWLILTVLASCTLLCGFTFLFHRKRKNRKRRK